MGGQKKVDWYEIKVTTLGKYIRRGYNIKLYIITTPKFGFTLNEEEGGGHILIGKKIFTGIFFSYLHQIHSYLTST